MKILEEFDLIFLFLSFLAKIVVFCKKMFESFLLFSLFRPPGKY